MDLAELKIKITVLADGVKAGIDKSKNELKRLSEAKGTKIELTANADNLTSGVRKSKDAIKELDSTTKEVEKSLNEMGMLGTVAFGAIVVSVKKGIDAFVQYTSTLNGLKAQMSYIGEDMGNAMDMVREKSKDGLMTEADVAHSIKNLTRYGMSLEQASLMIDRLKDSAANNREAHYSLSEAVRTTTEGIKNENSMLSDAAGVTKNIAKMVEDYATSLGRTKESLTQAERAQAIFLGTMEETEAVVGASAIHAETLGGAMDEASASANKLAQAFGESMAGNITILVKSVSDMTKGLTVFINENKGLVSGVVSTTSVLALGVAGFAGFTKALAFAKIAMVAFTASMGAFAPVLLVFSAAVGVFSAVKSSINETKRAQEELIETQKELNALVDAETNVDNYQRKTEELEKLTKAREAYIEVVTRAEEANLQLTQSDMDEWGSKYNISVEQLNETLAIFGTTLADSVTKNGEYTGALSELDEMIKTLSGSVENYVSVAEFDKSTLQIEEQLKSLDKLIKARNALADGDRLKKKDLNELIEIYPKLAQYLNETGDAYFKNGEVMTEVLRDVASAERDNLIQSEEIAKSAVETQKNKIDELIDTNRKLQDEISKGDVTDKSAYDENVNSLEEMRLKLEELEAQYVLAGAKVEIFKSTIAETDKAINYEKMIDDVQLLADSYETLAKGNRLAHADMVNLINLYPEIASYLAQTNDYTLKNGEILKDVGKTAIDVKTATMQADKIALDNQVENARIALEAEKVKYKGMIAAAQAYYSVVGVSLNATLQMDKFLEKPAKQIIEMKTALKDLEVKSLETGAAIDKINSISFGGGGGSGSKKGGGGGGGKTAKLKEEITEYQKQIKVMEDAKKLSEMANKEEYDWISKIATAHASKDVDIKDSKERLYVLTRDINKKTADDYIQTIKDMNTGSAESTDFAGMKDAIVNAKEVFFEQFKEYPQTLQTYLDVLYDLEVDASEKRAEKLTQIERTKVDTVLEQYDRQIEYLKAMDGLIMADGEKFNYSYFDELDDMSKKVMEVTHAIDALLATYNGDVALMNETDKKFYADLLAMREDFYRKMQLIDVQGQKKAQVEAEKAEKDRIKTIETANKEKLKVISDYYKSEIDLAKKAGKEVIETLKTQYDEQMELLKTASDSEIATHEARLSAIDKLTKKEDDNERNEQLLDRINRARELLKYEVNESNKYELSKEIANLEKEYAKNNKKDEGSALNEEKDRIKDQIQAIKDSNAEKIKALENLRNMETAQAEKSLETEVSLLEKKIEQQRIYFETGSANYEEYYAKQAELIRNILAEEKLANDTTTIDLKQNLEIREDGEFKSYAQREKLAENNVRETRDIMERGTNKILRDLFNHIVDYAEIGKRHGEIYAAGFNDAATGGLMMSVAYERALAISSLNLPPTGRTYTTNMTFNTPVATPSMVARETEDLMRNISRLD